MAVFRPAVLRYILTHFLCTFQTICIDENGYHLKEIDTVSFFTDRILYYFIKAHCLTVAVTKTADTAISDKIFETK